VRQKRTENRAVRIVAIGTSQICDKKGTLSWSGYVLNV